MLSTGSDKGARGLDFPLLSVVCSDSSESMQLRKLHQRLELMRHATAKAGGVYMYANQQGCDGGRLYYDGCACICLNGDLLAQV